MGKLNPCIEDLGSTVLLIKLMPYATTEDNINDIMASCLWEKGFKITTQIAARLYSGNKKPDFELSNGKLLNGTAN